ncbi:MAG: sigma 54-interacting transcriptional regulator, partial [Syntrophales bacterium LBB04]|nr:sigma 54-interacting transcriptional regulator [Syntrophales bacterium LBB04]
MPKMALWDQINEDHWLRDYGKTQVIVIDDQWSSKDPFLFVPLMERKTIEKKLNIAFHFFKPPDGGEWNDKWFFGELEKAKENCPRPSVILLDLMYGSENSPIKGSGKRFLNSLSNVDFWRDVPVLIITAGEEDESLLQELKQVGGSFQDFLGKMYPKEEPFSERVERGLLEYGLLSDPNIHAYSFKMRKTAQEMRKVLLDEKLKEEIRIPGIQTVFETRPKSVLFVGNSGDGKNHLADYLQEMSDRREAPYEVMTFSDVSDPKDIEPTLFGSGPFTDFRGRTTRIDSQTGQRSTRGDIELAIVGLVTNLDKGTILLDELGNSSPDMQKKLLRFLDTRQIKPNLVSLPENTSYIPSRKPYDLWVIMTMQPSHAKKLKDLVRRRGKMVRIDIPSLNECRAEVIP